MTERRKGGRPRTGTVETMKDGRLRPIAVLADGFRARLNPLPPGTSKAKAKECAAYWTEKWTAEGYTRADYLRAKGLEPKPEPSEMADDTPSNVPRAMATWVKAWLEDRRARGRGPAAGAHWRNHIAPVLGATHIASWSPAELRMMVAHLDDSVRDGRMAWKNAQNIWATVTSMCRDACRSKVDALRCRTDNPASAVEGPDRGAKKIKVYLYPSEVARLLACDAVPLSWRRWIAISIYTGVRAGELRVLRWADVDLEHASIHVHSAWNAKAKCVKATKGMLNRRVPIEPALAPLLESLKSDAPRELIAAGLPVESELASSLRRHLQRAVVMRAELFEVSETHKRLTWHDLRGTHATWCAVRGDEPLKIQRRMGHKEFSTTQGYIVEAENVRAGFGDPFPTLPHAILGEESSTPIVHASVASARTLRHRDGNRASPAGFEPALLA